MDHKLYHHLVQFLDDILRQRRGAVHYGPAGLFSQSFLELYCTLLNPLGIYGAVEPLGIPDLAKMIKGVLLMQVMVPRPHSLFTSMVPPWASVIDRAMANPNPDTPFLLCLD